MRPPSNRLFDRGDKTESRYLRRLVTIPAVLLGLAVAIVLGPLSVLFAALWDRGRPFRRVRLVLLVVGGLAIETLGIVAIFVLWVASGFGLWANVGWIRERYRALMGRYAILLLRLVSTAIGSQLTMPTDTDIDGPVIVLARHTSFFDALIPATLLSRHNQLIGHHVLAAGLRFPPCIDIVGHRLSTVFVRRTPTAASASLGPIEKLAGEVDEHSAAVIFPEGTFRSPARFERAMARLAESDPVAAQTASQLSHVLPPRPHGTWALMQGAPQADVIVCVNTGLEPFDTLANIAKSLGRGRPIVVDMWRIERSQIPSERAEFANWLLNEFVRVDKWVDSRRGSSLD